MIYIINYPEYLEVIFDNNETLKYYHKDVKFSISNNRFYIYSKDVYNLTELKNQLSNDTRIILFTTSMNNCVYLYKKD